MLFSHFGQLCPPIMSVCPPYCTYEVLFLHRINNFVYCNYYEKDILYNTTLLFLALLSCKQPAFTSPDLKESEEIIENKGCWEFLPKDQTLKIVIDQEIVNELLIFAEHDWENEKETILFAGLDGRGCSVWGKRIK